MLTTAAMTRDLDLAFLAFANDPLVNIPRDQAYELFTKMLDNTKAYLKSYNL